LREEGSWTGSKQLRSVAKKLNITSNIRRNAKKLRKLVMNWRIENTATKKW
jgi:hypothetical protein